MEIKVIEREREREEGREGDEGGEGDDSFRSVVVGQWESPFDPICC